MKGFKEYLLNEAKVNKRDTSNIKDWINDVSKLGNTLSDEHLNNLSTIIKDYFLNNIDYSSLGLGFEDKDLICDIAGYIIEAAVYDAIKSKHNVTNRSGRGLKIDGKSIYWDFAINGIDEKFEIKAKCKNGYHTGGISPSNNQKSDDKLIYIIIPYSASNEGFNIDIDNIKVQRGYKSKK